MPILEVSPVQKWPKHHRKAPATSQPLPTPRKAASVEGPSTEFSLGPGSRSVFALPTTTGKSVYLRERMKLLRKAALCLFPWHQLCCLAPGLRGQERASTYIGDAEERQQKGSQDNAKSEELSVPMQ